MNLALVTLLLFSTCFGQITLAKIDSIRIYHLPLSLKTFLALDEWEVINWKEKIMDRELLKIDLVKDSTELDKFRQSDFMNG